MWKADGCAGLCGHNRRRPAIPVTCPQLANPVSREEFERLLDSDDYFIQEKMDGVRMALRRNGAEVEAINRRGLLVAFPKEVEQEIGSLEGDFLLDGEMIGNTYWAFDALAIPTDPNLAAKSAGNRYLALTDLLQGLSKARGAPARSSEIGGGPLYGGKEAGISNGTPSKRL